MPERLPYADLLRNEAIAFKEWQDENLEGARWENYDGHDTWINPHSQLVISTTELYNIFKSQTQSKENATIQSDI